MEINKHHREAVMAEMRRLGFDDPLMEIRYDMLATNGLESYQVSQSVDFGDDRMLFQLDLKMDGNGLPYLHGYEAMLLVTHPIPHARFRDIDTKNLEDRLKRGEWNSDMDELSAIFGQLVELTSIGDDRASDIAARLEARYWLGKSVSSHINVDRLKERFTRRHYFEITGTISDIIAKQAYNLLCGRAIIRFKQINPCQRDGYWFWLEALDDSKTTRDYETVLSHEWFNPELTMKKLPIDLTASKRAKDIIVQGLIDGDLTHANITVNGKDIPVFLSVNPRKKTIEIYDMDRKELDVGELVSQEKKATQENKVASAIKKGRVAKR